MEHRLGDMLEKFSKLEDHKITVTLLMENSLIQSGRDFFSVKALIQGAAYKNLSLCKTAPSLHRALADVREHLLEVLNRFGDRVCVLERSKEQRCREAI